MLNRDLESIDEALLLSLEAEQTPEGLELDFKRELDLSSEKARREAAKDVSAMANTVGGRLVYGLDEKELPDGRVVAGPVRALSDGALADRLADVLADTLHPRPSFRVRNVAVTGGFVLVVEVYPSPTDLHMVTGYNEHRFYRRGAKGNVVMTEPEVREAYARIVSTRASIDTRLKEVIGPELKLRSQKDESIVIVPWHTSPGMLDPRAVEGMGGHLATAILPGLDLADYARSLRLGAEGYRIALGDHRPEDLQVYLAILKNGLVHLSTDSAVLWTTDQKTTLNLRSATLLVRLLWTLLVAQRVYEEIHYWGPARVFYHLRWTAPLGIDHDSVLSRYSALEAPPGALEAVPVDLVFRQVGRGLGRFVKEIMDQVFQTVGEAECPYFDEAGSLLAMYREQWFPTNVVKALQ